MILESLQILKIKGKNMDVVRTGMFRHPNCRPNCASGVRGPFRCAQEDYLFQSNTPLLAAGCASATLIGFS